MKNNHEQSTICFVQNIFLFWWWFQRFVIFIPTWENDRNLANIVLMGPVTWHDIQSLYEGQFTVARVLGRKHVNFMNGFVSMKRHYHHYEWWIIMNHDQSSLFLVNKSIVTPPKWTKHNTAIWKVSFFNVILTGVFSSLHPQRNT